MQRRHLYSSICSPKVSGFLYLIFVFPPTPTHGVVSLRLQIFSETTFLLSHQWHGSRPRNGLWGGYIPDAMSRMKWLQGDLGSEDDVMSIGVSG